MIAGWRRCSFDKFRAWRRRTFVDLFVVSRGAAAFLEKHEQNANHAEQQQKPDDAADDRANVTIKYTGVNCRQRPWIALIA